MLLLVLASPCPAMDIDNERSHLGVGNVVDIEVLVTVAELRDVSVPV